MAEGLMQNLKVDLPRKIDLPGAGTVNLRQVDQAAAEVVNQGTDLVVDVALALALVVIGWVASRWLARMALRAFTRAHMDETFSLFIASVVRYTFFLASVVGAFSLLGLSSTSIVALFGAIGLAVAFALRNTLSHVAAGVMLVVNQPFKVGDYIEVGTREGTVKRITLFNTELNTLQNQRVFLPNTQIWENVMLNHTYNAQRAVDLSIRVAYEAPGEKVKETLMRVIDGNELILKSPAPLVGVDALGDSGVDYLIRVWVRTSDFVAVRYGFLEQIKQALTTDGIELPLPQQVVYLRREKGSDHV